MRRLWKLRTLYAVCVASISTGALAGPVEQQVLDALNFARTNPRGYAESLRTFRTYFHAAAYRLPGASVSVLTREGTAAVDETVAFLGRQAPLPPIAAADLLARSAANLSADQAGAGGTGHQGSDGSEPGDRVRRAGGGDYVAEVIAYGASDAADVVRQLIVDDGVRDRGHRGVLFSPDLRFAGVSCGPHRAFRTMCVVDLAATADGRFAREIRMARVDLPGRIGR